MKEFKISKQITNRESHSLNKYLQEIAKMDMITPEEEIDLAQRIRRGDHLALEKLTKANLRFVVSVAKKYQNYGMPLGDLINEGNLGLIKAAGKFDETRGFKFISYAVWWIRQSIIQSLVEHSRIVRLPLNRVNGLNKIQKTFSVLEQQYQRDPTTQELADAMGVSSELVGQNQRHTGRHVSVDAAFHEGETGNLLDVLPNHDFETPDSGVLHDSLKIDILRALSALTPRENQVIVHYYGLDGNPSMTLEELGERFHLTRERVRQIKEKATLRLKKMSAGKSLMSYL